jgi:tetratricopeptide (TPR) repeat protein
MKFLNRFQNQFIKKWRLYIILAIASFSFFLTLPSFANSPEHSQSIPRQISQSGTPGITPLETGLRLYESSRYGEAIELWQQELGQMEPSQQALCLSYLALAFQKMGNGAAAEEAIAQSRQRPQTLPPNPQLSAQILNSQGRIQISMGQPEAALTSWEQAEQQYSAAADVMGQLGSQINQAQALQTLGLYRRAQSLLEQINTTLQKQPDSPLKALGLKSLGTVLQVTGNLNESRQVLRQSLDIQQLAIQSGLDTIQSDKQSTLSDTQFSLANTLRSLQEPEAALKFYQQSAELATTRLVQRHSLILG